jgi:hypothetical protein
MPIVPIAYADTLLEVPTLRPPIARMPIGSGTGRTAI